MTDLVALWLPILVSAVLVFVASALVHMLPLWHKGDYPGIPNEAAFRSAVAPFAIPPGDYMVPRAANSAEMRSPEFTERVNQGPVMIMTVIPNGQMSMATSLSLWFVYTLVVSFFAAYVAGRALPPGAEYIAVFRFAGVAAFLSYAVGVWQMSIWYKRAWSSTLKETLDGLIYALLTAGTFGWLWPK